MRLKSTLYIATLVIMLFAISCSQNTDESASGADSSKAENFTLDSLTENKQVSLDDFRGKGVVLNFWATWCSPCREEMPLFEETWKEFKDQEVIFIGVNVMDDNENAQDFMDQIGISYPNLYDPEGNVSRKYNVVALPATFFIDKEGNIVMKNYGSFVGKNGKEMLNKNVKELTK